MKPDQVNRRVGSFDRLPIYGSYSSVPSTVRSVRDPRSKNGRPKRLPLADESIRTLLDLPSYRFDDYVFPADRANVRFRGKQMHLWDIRKPFQPAIAPASKVCGFTICGKSFPKRAQLLTHLLPSLNPIAWKCLKGVAGTTGIEPATSDVTGMEAANGACPPRSR